MARLEIQIGEQSFQVTELSEEGIRILAQDIPGVADILVGTLRLSSGEQIPVEGVFERRDDDEIVFADLQGVSYANIVAEQRRLLKKYPSFS